MQESSCAQILTKIGTAVGLSSALIFVGLGFCREFTVFLASLCRSTPCGRSGT